MSKFLICLIAFANFANAESFKVVPPAGISKATADTLYAPISVSGGGDNLGNHIATKTLDMASFPIINGGNIGANSISLVSGGSINSGGQNNFTLPTTFSSSVTVNNNFNVNGSTFVVKNGLIGIGTSAPTYQLDVAGFGRFSRAGTSLYVNTPNNISGGAIGFQEISADKALIQYTPSGYVDSTRRKDLEIVGNSAGGITFWPGGNVSAKFDKNGNLGIGTVLPYTKLHLSSGIFTNDGSGSGITTTGNMTAINYYGNGSYLTGIVAGDNLGNHIATTTLKMGGYDIATSSGISGLAQIVWADGTVQVSSPIAGGGAGDNLGNHIATTTLDMNNYAIESSSYVNTAYGFKINGYNAMINFGGNYSNLGISANAGLQASGTENIFIGYESGRYNTANQNTFIGGIAGGNNSSGYHNTFIGYMSGVSNGTGFSNTFIGYTSGYGNTASYNTYIGDNVGYQNGAGEKNVLVGYNAGSMGNANSNCTFVGYQAGFNAGVFFGGGGGDNNTLIGYMAGYNIMSGAGNIVIGYGQDTTSASASNELNIGGLIVGDMSISSATVKGSLSADSLTLTSSTIIMNGLLSPATGYALCLNGSNQITVCTSVVGVDGSCTCP